jgi:4-hydroxy-tetrahydrodipicolinate synthase
MLDLKGIYVSVISPFTNNYDLDIDGFKEHIRIINESDVQGMVIAGTNGEFSSLSTDERKSLYKSALDARARNKLVICNIGCESTEETRKLAAYCKDIGADAVMITPPYFIFPSEDGIIRHFNTISKSADVPIILFNIPYLGHPNLHPDLVHKLTEIKNIVGLKESDLSIYQLFDQIGLNGGRISVFSGLGANFLPAMAAGARGLITTWPEFVPKIACSMYDLIERGDLKAAREMHLRIVPLARSMGDASKIKAGFEMMGLPAGPPRLPLLPATDEEKQRINKALCELGVLPRN